MVELMTKNKALPGDSPDYLLKKENNKKTKNKIWCFKHFLLFI